MPVNQYPQWDDQNLQSKYPFVDNATMELSSGVSMPHDLFYDASVTVAGLDGMPALRQIEIFDNVATFVFSDNANDRFMTASTPATGESNRVLIKDALLRNSGVLVSRDNRLAWLQSLRPGVHTLLNLAYFVPSIVTALPQTAAVRDTLLVGEDGVELTCESSHDFDAAGQRIPVTLIRAHALGNPLFVRDKCGDAEFRSPNFLRLITFVQGDNEVTCDGDDNGNVLLLSNSQSADDAAIRIRPSALGIDIGFAGPSNG